ncbi:protein FAM228B-like isoform X2 [Gigantopelta aegis]|uniref:protein FAM228B-like isoform X2 n=1 Tax=Gigantopelta aegis TaxID=1735272 RepID=UPI001B88C94A|nr:protein FAM228B-like isoform X2 [Gigantopelta aegis]
MTSMLCVKQLGGNVKVYDKELIEDLGTTQTGKHLLCKRYSMRSGRRYGNHSSISDVKKFPTGMTENSVIANTVKAKDWLSSKSIQQLQEGSDADAKSVKNLYNPLLETEKTFVQDIDNYLHCEDLLTLRKKELLHKRWTDHVYEPLRREIIQVMDGDKWRDTDRRKRVLHKQYLEFVNEKGHIFLETLNPREYYAQSLNGFRPAPIKVDVNRLRDPLTSQGRERNQEDQAILQCVTGQKFTDSDIEQIRLPLHPLVPLGRHGDNSISWLKMPFSDIESPTRQASRRKVLGHQSKSNINQENWSNSSYDPDILEKEWHVQRKRMYLVTPPFDVPPVRVSQMPFIGVDRERKHCVSV